MKTKVGCAFTLLFCLNTYAVDDAATATSAKARSSEGRTEKLPETTQGKFLKIKEHSKCNEIQTQSEPDQNGKTWRDIHRGGSEKVLSGIPELKKNLIFNSAFGTYGNKIAFSLKGKNATDTLGEEDRTSADFSELQDPEDKKIYGKFLGFTDPRESGQFQMGGERKKGIRMAVIYFNSDPDSSSLQVKCDYVAKNLNFQELEKNGKCVWIDIESLASNGKPYCW